MALVPSRLQKANGMEPELLTDAAPGFARLLETGTSVHVVVLDGAGRVVRANRAFIDVVGHAVATQPMRALLLEESQPALEERLRCGRTDTFVLLSVRGRDGGPVSLRFLVEPLRGGHILIGEPTFDHLRELERQLQEANAALAALVRENARQARALEAANRELRDAHWHIEKIAEVLPMCIGCRRVRTAPETWEDVASYLLRSSEFLSHGYCAGCAARMQSSAVATKERSR